MGSLSLQKYVSRDHGKGPRACQLGIHQDIRAALAPRHAECGGAAHGGARTFHGLYIAHAARIDRMFVPETQPSTQPAPGSPNACPGVQCCPRGRWQCHHTSPGTNTGPMTHPWDTPLCNKSRHFILSRPRGAAAAQRNGPCEMQDSGARTLSGVSQPFLGDG